MIELTTLEIQNIMINSAFVGMFVGILFFAVIALIINYSQRKSVRTFIAEMDDVKNRGIILSNIEDLSRDLKALVDDTNSKFFKGKYNSVIELMATLKKVVL